VAGAPHTSTGDLTGQGSTLAGTAAHIAKHATTGDLLGAGAALAGTAARVAGAVTHVTSGALIGQGAAIDGTAKGSGEIDGGYMPERRRYVAVKRGKKYLLFDDQEQADEFLLAEAAAQENATKPRKVRRKGPKPPTAKVSIDTEEIAPLLRKYAPNVDLDRMIRAHEFEQVLQAKVRALMAQDDDEAEFLLMVA